MSSGSSGSQQWLHPFRPVDVVKVGLPWQDLVAVQVHRRDVLDHASRRGGGGRWSLSVRTARDGQHVYGRQVALI